MILTMMYEMKWMCSLDHHYSRLEATAGYCDGNTVWRSYVSIVVVQEAAYVPNLMKLRDGNTVWSFYVPIVVVQEAAYVPKLVKLLRHYRRYEPPSTARLVRHPSWELGAFQCVRRLQ
jgi:hypothetical protein